MPQVAVGHQQLRHAQPPGLEAPQHCGPRLRRLAEARRHGEDFLGAVRHGPDDDQQGRLVLLEARLHIDPVRPGVDQLPARERALLPPGVLPDPLLPQPAHRGLRQRRPVAQQAPQRQFEVPLGQAVQVQLHHQLGRLLRPPREQRQHPALEPFLHVADPGPAHLHSPRGQRQVPRLPVPVAVSLRPALDRHPALRLRPAAEELRDLVFQDLLDELLDLPADHLLQRLPQITGLPSASLRSFPHETAFLSRGLLPGSCEWCHRLKGTPSLLLHTLWPYLTKLSFPGLVGHPKGNRLRLRPRPAS